MSAYKVKISRNAYYRASIGTQWRRETFFHSSSVVRHKKTLDFARNQIRYYTGDYFKAVRQQNL